MLDSPQPSHGDQSSQSTIVVLAAPSQSSPSLPCTEVARPKAPTAHTRSLRLANLSHSDRQIDWPPISARVFGIPLFSRAVRAPILVRSGAVGALSLLPGLTLVLATATLPRLSRRIGLFKWHLALPLLPTTLSFPGLPPLGLLG